MSRPILRLLLIAAALPALSACDGDSTGPDVGPSSLTVHAYVDADGSGTFDTGDTPLGGESIVLTGPAGDAGATSRTATTDAEGVVTFDGLEPGSYALSYEGVAPAGATLAGPTTPVVVAQTVRQALEAEFRFVSFPGGIAGVLYRDENANGVFDEGDTPAPGIPVAVYAGSTAEGEPVDETTTSDQGAYAFDGLRPGTYTVVFSPFPTMELEGGNSVTVMVGADAVSTPSVEFTGNLLSPIGDARALAEADDSAVVAVKGTVAWQPSFSDDLFIQDGTGGIQVYARNADVRDLGLEPGDRVIVVGEVDLRFGEPQITNVSALMVQGSGDAPTPEPTTAETINAGAVGHQLVTVEGATVTGIDTLQYDNQFVTLTDAAGNEFGVYADSRTGVEPAVWTMGGVYDVTGVVGYDSRYPYANRIEVRGTEDVVPGDQPISIADAQAAEAGIEVSVAGTVIAQPSFGDELFIQDETGGIQIYARDADVRTLGLEPGDVVRVTGTTEDYYDERQITSVTYLALVGTGDAPAPMVVTPAEIASGDQVHQLVRVEGATVLEVDTSWNEYGNQLVRLRAPNGEEFGVYVDSRTGVEADAWTVGAVYDVTGVINYDSRYGPGGGYGPFDYRVWVRGSGDVVAN